MNTPRLSRYLIQLLAAFGIAITLSGCIVLPVNAPGYYRPHHYRYYR